MNWHSIKLEKNSTKNNVRARVEIGSGSLWFSGHFPNEPILPGIAVLSMVFDAILLASKEDLRLLKFKKIRFKQMIKPGDCLEIKAEKQNSSLSYSFLVYTNGIQACKGTLIVDHSYKKC